MDRSGWNTNPRPVTGPTTGREKQKKRWESSARAGLRGLKCHNKQYEFHPTGDRPSSKDNEGLEAVLQENRADSRRTWLHFLGARCALGTTRYEGLPGAQGLTPGRQMLPEEVSLDQVDEERQPSLHVK